MTKKQFEEMVLIYRVMMLGRQLSLKLYNGGEEQEDIIIHEMLNKVDYKLLRQSKEFVEKFTARYNQLEMEMSSIKQRKPEIIKHYLWLT